MFRGALEERLPASEVSYSLVSREDERGLNFFLSCVSKQRDLFERHLDYRVKKLLFKPLKLRGHARRATSKQSVGDEEREQLKASTPPSVSAERRGSCPAFFFCFFFFYTAFGSRCMVEHLKSI